MIYKNKNQYSSIYKKLIYCVLSIIAAMFFTLILKKYFKPFLITAVLLLFCYPVYNLLIKLNFTSKKISAVITIVIINIVFMISLFFIGRWIYSIRSIIVDTYYSLLKSMENISITFNLNVQELNEKMEGYYLSVLDSNFLKRGAAYTTESVLNYFIGNITAYFILIDRYVILNAIKKVFPLNMNEFLMESWKDLKMFIKIEIILIIVTTIETILGLWALNISNFFILGIICGILDFLPYVGTIIVFFPLIIYKIVCKDYIIVFGLVCLYILLLIIRQIMETRFMSSKFKIHPLIAILSLYVGLKTFGLIGIIMAPVCVIICKSILESKA